MKKLLIITILVLLILLLIILIVRQNNNKSKDVTIQDNQPTTSVTKSISPTPPSDITENTKINPNDNLCPQVSKEFVSQATGITIVRTSSINDVSINACNYYLTDESNSPYIAIIVNKNLNFEKHKQIAVNNKMVIKTDSQISGNHFISWADNETRISNINIYLDENNFLRVAKNVDRTIDNEGLVKLASALSKRL